MHSFDILELGLSSLVCFSTIFLQIGHLFVALYRMKIESVPVNSHTRVCAWRAREYRWMYCVHWFRLTGVKRFPYSCPLEKSNPTQLTIVWRVV